ncbi:S-adenosylmethionine:tRNA ribosyltransferase-isomerase [Persicitalea jodogahamensis]|uniref:S-adenosylmethionine:tRNA ribosyltransferase-isomerase n=1 Tax=Persicitalea jodogahamensis TaxID=402147 RepID=A0A8J3D038_9BACT|nr:S-adenosylmethionine:tRNA ribosyltransferase-isomerase [Persicitalea jodogahamensis]GHB51905.1 S-adenosylmethionine:tRNA ribosyltransferase-isomerase [Persicitalea jodogahamensis]
MPEIHLSDYTYELPDERIARYPVSPRDSSRLLVYENGEISHHRFHQLTEQLPAESLLVFNDTKVIPARVYFQKPTGATIQLLLLNPEAPTGVINDAMLVTRQSIWTCMIGNKKRWKFGEKLISDLQIGGQTITLEASYADYDQNLVQLDWDSEVPFLEIVKALGEIPLPPYLRRDTEAQDTQSYQTVYARQEGAVAAPTAGLHFTDAVLSALAAKGIEKTFLTLHVGAGTFQPIKVENVQEHHMHSEQVVYTRELVQQLLKRVRHIVSVGTTSLRSLESLYWFGVKLLRQETEEFWIEKLYPYQFSDIELPTAAEALGAVLDFLEKNNRDEITGQTEIFIFPGYRFRLCKGLITNYHQPGSTLILLVAAFIGEDWHKVYDEALTGDYRFLSYGDSSLLWGNTTASL